MRGEHANHLRASQHYRWSAMRKIVSSGGYVKLRVGRSHPLADPNGYAYEHLLVWVSAGNPRPPAGHVLHHRSGDRSDNRVENLELLSRGDHNRYHNAARERGNDGRFVGKKRAGASLDGREWKEFPDA